MMTSCSILNAIQHYQRSIDRSTEDEQRILHCIGKLYSLPVKVEHLQMTGIGKTVNSLRKYNGEISVAAKALVTKWKAMVAAEEEPLESPCNNNKNESNNSSEKESSDDQNISRKNTHSNLSSTCEGQSSHRVDKNDNGCKSDLENNSTRTENHKLSKLKSNTTNFNYYENKETERKHRSREREEKTNNIESDRQRQSERERHKHTDSNDVKDKKKDRVEKSLHHKSENSNHKYKSSSSKFTKDDDSRNHHQHEKSSMSDEQSNNKYKSDKIRGSPKASSSKNVDKHHNEKIGNEQHHKHRSSKDRDKKNKPSSSSHSSSSKSSTHKSSKSKSTVKSTSYTSDRKRRHNADSKQSNSKLPQAKVAKIHMQNNSDDDNDDTADGFDSSMGANFNDILGMLNVPTVKSKKSSSSSKVTQSGHALRKSPLEKVSKNSSKQSHIEKGQTNYVNGIKPSTSSKSILNGKPNLLSPCAKLEPLDPNIALELPTTSISTNYKPMPLNQTVMDCVFKTSNSNASKSLSSLALSEAEAISHGISSKTMRTKIYSGVRTGQIMQVPTLFDLCIRVLQKHIDALEYTGGVPFEVLRPVLERATPQQLLVFEDYNPYLMEDTDVLWQQHCGRNYRLKKRQEMESWREMFLRCQDDQERKLNILAESIKQSQKIIAAPIRKTQLAFVDSMVKPPRNVQRKQEQYGTKSKITATPAARVAALSSVTPNAVKSGDSRLRVAQNVRDHAQVSTAIVRPKKAPLMAKTLQFMRGRLKR